MSTLLLHLKRLVGLDQDPPMASQEGQLRYVRADGDQGVLYLALGSSDDTTYLWSALVGLDASGGLTTTGDTTLGNQSTDTHTIAGRIITTGSAPSIAVNAVNTTGAGVGAIASITGNNQSGSLTIDPAGTPGAGTLATITFFGIDRGGASYGIWLTPDDADALLDDTKVRAIRASGTQWTLIANAALSLNVHVWHYLVIEN